MFDYDICIIGGGILGCMAARNLTRYQVKVLLLEEREDVCTGITRANTAIVYPGYDNKPGTLKSRLCVRANQNFTTLCRELLVPFHRCGSLMICSGEKGAGVLQKKYRNGLENGVEGLRLLTGEEVHKLEPNYEGPIHQGLYSPNTGTVQPWALGIAAYENARQNGCEVQLNARVTDISFAQEGYEIQYLKEGRDVTLRVRGILNCAGLHAHEIRELVLPPSIRIFPQKADYLVFDRRMRGFVNHIIFEEPEEKGKGLTLVPTVSGNLLAGPSEQPQDSSPAFSTTREGLRFIEEKCRRLFPALPMDQVIRNFGSMRPNPYEVLKDPQGNWIRGDRSINSFLIDEPKEAPGFVSLIGIKTPGLTCADELTRYVTERLLAVLGSFPANPDFQPIRKLPIQPETLSCKDRNQLIQKKPSYGKIICHCQGISEGEILAAIRRGAVTVDGVKRRLETGMGRCQGSRCTYAIAQLLSKELSIPLNQVNRNSPHTPVIEGDL